MMPRVFFSQGKKQGTTDLVNATCKRREHATKIICKMQGFHGECSLAGRGQRGTDGHGKDSLKILRFRFPRSSSQCKGRARRNGKAAPRGNPKKQERNRELTRKYGLLCLLCRSQIVGSALRKRCRSACCWGLKGNREARKKGVSGSLTHTAPIQSTKPQRKEMKSLCLLFRNLP